MNTNYIIYNGQLYHHGVKGMKWGVRRYRRSDGSYTKTGLKVFDKKMDEYERIDKKVKSLKNGDKNSYNAAIAERKAAKKKLDASYKQLKADERADKGKELYGKGKTITGNLQMNAIAQVGIVVGSRVVNNIIAKYTNNDRLANISTSAIAIGGTAVNAILASKASSDNRNLRAYYGHSRKIK